MSERAAVKHRSVSQLQTWSKCSYDYFLSRVARVPQRTAAWFVQGTAVHAAIELYEKSYRSLTADEVAAVFEWHWDADLAKNEAKQPDHSMWMVGGRKRRETDLQTRRELGRQQSIDYVNLNAPGDAWMPTEFVPGQPAVEIEFSLDLGGVKVVGYIDAVMEELATGRLRPRDQKTGTKQPIDPFQLATYKIAIEEMTGVEVTDGEWWMCKNGAATEPFPLGRYDRDAVTEWYVRMDESEKAGHYLANPGDHCFTCTSKPYCQYATPDARPIPERMPPGADFS